MDHGRHRVSDFPLFPLGIVALPREIVPLHIFEERYKTMIGVCLERGPGVRHRVVVRRRRAADRLRVRDTEVLERMDDGRLNILTRGTRPFRVVARAGRPALSGRDGRVPRAKARSAPTSEVAQRGARDLRGLVERATDSGPSPSELDGDERLPDGRDRRLRLEAKQGLLDLRSENARLRLVTRLFRAAAKRLEFVERAQERARSNGKVRFG